MRIAIPYWQGRVSPVFDQSRRLLLVEIKNGREIRREEITLRHNTPLLRAKDIAELGTEVLICGAISLILEQALISENIRIIAYTCGPVKDVINAFLRSRLSNPEFLMPGCARKRFPPEIQQ